MADIDSNSLNNFVSALNKASKSLGDMQKVVDAATKSTQNAAKAADGAAKTTQDAAKAAAKVVAPTAKVIEDATKKIKDDFSKDVLAALNADGKDATKARVKARDDLYNNLKRGLADTTGNELVKAAGAASTDRLWPNAYLGAFVGGFAKEPPAAAAAVGAAAGAGTGAKADAGGNATTAAKQTDAAKSTDFLVDLASQAGEKIRGSLGDMLFNVLDGNFKKVGKSFRDMLRQMLADAAASQISKLAGAALGWVGNAIGGMFGGGSSMLPQYSTLFGGSTGGYAASIFGDGPMAAKGMALQNGTQLRAFARGGIVNSPTLFPMATGTGLMGEAGPEAIMPLTRGSDGRLGVRSSRDGGSGVNNNISITVNVGSNGNAQSDTQGQSDDAGRQLAAMVEGKVKEVMTREQRQGGILWRMQHA